MKLTLMILSGLFFPALLYMVYASYKVNSNFKKYSAVTTNIGTADQVAQTVLRNAGINDVEIKRCGGHLTDHYNPEDNCVYLSDSTFGRNSISAIGVALHEVGHAMQYAENYKFVRVRTALVPIVSFSSKWSMPLLMIALITEMFFSFNNPISNALMLLSILFYGMYTLFTLVTLPVEFNASKRAITVLKQTNMMNSEEIACTKQVLSSAAQTYLANFLFSLVQLARLLLMYFSRRND
ncbi:MAG: zinc metallopeptidase [Clostridia bacterium]